jgi:serine/threonine protein kinase
MGDGAPPNAELPIFRTLRMVTNPAVPSPTFQEPDKWSADANDFVLKCLEKDPSKRPSAAELLVHPFLKSVPGPEVLREAMMSALEIKKRQTTELPARTAAALAAPASPRSASAPTPTVEPMKQSVSGSQVPSDISAPMGSPFASRRSSRISKRDLSVVSAPASTAPTPSASPPRLSAAEENVYGTMVQRPDVSDTKVSTAEFGTMVIVDEDAYGTMVLRDTKPSAVSVRTIFALLSTWRFSLTAPLPECRFWYYVHPRRRRRRNCSIDG